MYRSASRFAHCHHSVFVDLNLVSMDLIHF
jgi:hypothetical protein